MPLADVLTSAGINYAPTVIAECERYGVPAACLCVLLVKETGLPPANVYGHDLNACMTVPGRLEVTRDNYLAYRACVAAGGKRNGVGPLQLTWWELQDEADKRGGCWNPEVSIQVGVEHFARLYRTGPDLWTAFRRWNGTGLRAEAYADDALLRLPFWQRIVEELPVLMPGVTHRMDASDVNAKTDMSRHDVLCFHTSVTASPAPAAHFSILWDGTIIQHRDTGKRSSANYNGNPRVIAVECMDRGTGFPVWDTSDGHAVPAMTPQQVISAARIARWAHETHGIPLRFATDSKPTTRGVSVHRAGIDGNWAGYAFTGRVSGGELWSTALGKACPGDRRIFQVRDEIIPLAAGPQEDDVSAREVWDFLIPEGGTLDTPTGSKWPAWSYLRNPVAAILAGVAANTATLKQVVEAVTRDNPAVDTDALLALMDTRLDETEAEVRKALTEGMVDVQVTVRDQTTPE